MDKRVLRRYVVVSVVIVIIFMWMNRPNTPDVNIMEHIYIQETTVKTMTECEKRPVQLPPTDRLQSMAVDDIAAVYHRYVNTMQTLCPMKPMYGGMHQGWQICQMPEHSQPNVVYFISQKESVAMSKQFLQELSSESGAETHLILSSTVEKAMAEKQVSSDTRIVYSLFGKPLIHILLIHAGKQSSDIVEWLFSKKIFAGQLIVKFESVDQTSTAADYLRQIKILSRLHDEGYRIFHLSREPDKCLYKLGGADVAGCYIIYMMRCESRLPVIELLSMRTPPQRSPLESMLLYHRYALSTQILCKDVVRVGDINDGGWEVCNDTEYRPSSNCLVYSFGIAEDWTFDDEVSRRYGCEVHAFDPSIGKEDHKHAEKVWFHNLGLGNNDGKKGTWQMKTFDSIKSMLGHTGRIVDYVKMDIEESEWPVLANMLSSGALKNVRQLAVEFHTFYVNPPATNYLEKLDQMSKLFAAGFKIFWAHPNQVSGNERHIEGTTKTVTVCYELYFLNTHLRRVVFNMN